MSWTLKRGDRIVASDGTLVVSAILKHEGVVKAVPESGGEVRTIEFDELRNMLASGDWEHCTDDPEKGKTIAHKRSRAAEMKHHYNKKVVKSLRSAMESGKSLAQAYEARKAESVKMSDGTQRPMCSRSTAYRLMSQAASGGGLKIPKSALSGNRNKRKSEPLRQLALALAKTEYSTPNSRFTLRDLTKLVNQTALAAGVITEHEKVSIKWIAATIRECQSTDLDAGRTPKERAKGKDAVAKHPILISAAFDRVEQDTLHMAFIVTLPDGSRVEVRVILTIECKSSVPLAWWICIGAPTAADTLSCLERAMYPKRTEFKRLGIDCAIDPFGHVLTLILDNGPENSGVDGVLSDVQTDVTFTPANEPFRKPFIERLNRSIKEALQTLPGSTRHNDKDGVRTKEAFEDENLMSLAELERRLVRFLYEQWIHTPLERLMDLAHAYEDDVGCTPYQLWKKLEATTLLPPPPSPDRWRRAAYQSTVRRLNRKTGISLEGFDYKGEHLRTLIRDYGPNERVEVLYRPDDFRMVYVADKKTGRLLPLACTRAKDHTPAFSFLEAKKRNDRLYERAEEDTPAAPKNFVRDVALQSLSPRGVKAAKKALQKAGVDTAKLAQAIERSRERPLVGAPAQRAAPDNGSAVPPADTEAPQKLATRTKSRRPGAERP